MRLRPLLIASVALLASSCTSAPQAPTAPQYRAL